MSTPAKSQPAKTNDSRTKLLAGASICFLKSGFAATSLDDIATESKVVKQTIYNHFQTKETLFREAVDYLMHRLEINLDEQWLSAEPYDFFCKVGKLNLTLLQNKRMTDLLQLAVKESKNFPELQDMYSEAIPEPMLAFVSNYLERITKAPKHQCDIFSWAFRSAITGYATLYNTNQLTAETYPRPSKYIFDLATIFTALIEKISSPPVSIPQARQIAETLNHESFAEETIFADTIRKLTTNQMAIIRAALRVFAEKGYIETTMLDVSAQANVSKQTVYKHFKSKDVLYKTFCQAYLERLQTKCQHFALQHNPSVEFVLRDTQCLFALSSHDWFLRLFRTLIAESYFFPVEANRALIFLFTLGEEINNSAAFQNENGLNENVTLQISKLIAIRSISGNFILSKQIYKLSGNLEVNENEIFDLLIRLTAVSF
ncbi:MAG: TetR family transcriptional regulator [Candidatus Obscuribacterales bacterium]|nr:TetR family transcriptional regulator [Candidatus Obscuribacterales bacterium]